MRLQSYFEAVAQEVRLLTASLGAEKLQDLVGRADLLEQVRAQEKIDLSAMLQAAPLHTRFELEPGVGRLLTRPRNSLTRLMSELILDTISDDEQEVTYQDEVMAYDRALGSRLAGELTRRPQLTGEVQCLHLRFGPSSVAGNGFAAWVNDPVDVLIEGGAQDGVAKGASGGRVAVMKGLNHEGLRIDGSVGKSFAYGAQGGVFLVQGDADSRACIRLSGASVVLAGEIKQPLDDSSGSMGTHANLKGFACEYMTSGEVLILGDPGPYAFAGMTGGVVYQKLTPEMGFDLAALRRRLAQGAHVEIQSLTHHDVGDVKRLLGYYIKALDQTHQYEEGERMRGLCEESAVLAWFVKVIPSTTESLHRL
jgi:glutamate synthase (NADPH/NADH) large chain